MRKFIGIERLSILDDRWYEVLLEVRETGKKTREVTEMFASVTTKLQALPLEEGLKEFFKTAGHNGDLVFKLQGEFGSAAHSLLQAVLTKHPVWLKDHPPRVDVYDPGTTLDEMKALDGLPLENVAQSVKPTELWERFGRWCDFWFDLNQKYEVEIIDIEYLVYDLIEKTAGTVDIHLRIRERPDKDNQKDESEYPWKNIVIDWKFGNGVHRSHHLQVAKYADMSPGQIDEAWLVHIPRKKPNEKGYSVIVLDDIPKYYKSGTQKGQQKGKTITQLVQQFKSINRVWHIVNPNAKPKTQIMEVKADLATISKKPLFIEEKADAKPTR